MHYFGLTIHAGQEGFPSCIHLRDKDGEIKLPIVEYINVYHGLNNLAEAVGKSEKSARGTDFVYGYGVCCVCTI